MGEEVTQDPMCAPGANLTISSKRLHTLRAEGGIERCWKRYAETKGVAEIVYATYGKDCTPYQKRRWRTRGATIPLLPYQGELNECLGKLTGLDDVRGVTFRGLPRNWGKPKAALFKKVSSGSSVSNAPGLGKCNLPGFRVTQSELKQIPKEALEEDEQKVIG